MTRPEASVLLRTVGTSFRTAGFGKAHPDPAAALAAADPADRGCGAEVNSVHCLIRNGLARPDAGVLLFHSDTDDGRAVAAILADYYRDRGHAPAAAVPVPGRPFARRRFPPLPPRTGRMSSTRRSHTTCRPSRRGSGRRAVGRGCPTGWRSGSSGSCSSPAAGGRTCRPNSGPPGGQPTAGWRRGSGSGCGAGSTPTGSGCSSGRASGTRIRSPRTGGSCGRSAAARGPAEAPWIAGNRAPSTPCWSAAGGPLAARSAGASASDHPQLFPALLAFPRVGGTPGRPKEFPDGPYADRGSDCAAARARRPWRGVEPHGSGLGQVRWAVERTISRIKRLRRMRVRYDRSAVIHAAWTSPAASAIRFRIPERRDPTRRTGCVRAS